MQNITPTYDCSILFEGSLDESFIAIRDDLQKHFGSENIPLDLFD